MLLKFWCKIVPNSTWSDLNGKGGELESQLSRGSQVDMHWLKLKSAETDLVQGTSGTANHVKMMINRLPTCQNFMLILFCTFHVHNPRIILLLLVVSLRISSQYHVLPSSFCHICFANHSALWGEISIF